MSLWDLMRVYALLGRVADSLATLARVLQKDIEQLGGYKTHMVRCYQETDNSKECIVDILFERGVVKLGIYVKRGVEEGESGEKQQSV